MSKLYREQGASGGSKLLASIALGQSQSSVIATARFENEILDVSTLLSTKEQREEAKAKRANSQPKTDSNPQEAVGKKEVGRQEKPDDQKSEKTIQNREAMS